MRGIKAFEDKYGRDGLSPDNHDYNLEDYGEMVPTLFSWITPEEQRRRASEIQDMMDKSDGKAKDLDLGFKNLGLK